MAEPRFSIVTPVYETPAGVLRAMLRSVRAPALSRLGAVPRRRRLERAACRAQMLEAAQRRDPRIRVKRRERERRHRRRVQRRPGDGPGRVRRPARPRRQAPPRRAGIRRRGARRRARGRLRLHRRGQDRPRRPALRALLQAGLVARADAHPDVHLPPQRPAPVPGRRGRRVRPGVRGVPGLGPGAQGDRAGAERASTSPGSSITGARSRPRPPASGEARSRGRSRPASARYRPIASGSACRRASSATRRCRASTTCTPPSRRSRR